jgi:CubicO group peptidase (beta-lactamase class C family)
VLLTLLSARACRLCGSYEEGRFQLSDPLHLYLGASWKKENMSVYVSGHPKAGDKRGPVVTEPCHKTVTIVDVLTHSSGLSYGFDAEGIANPVDAIYNAELKEGSLPLLEWAERLSKLPLFFQPQSAWHYGYNTDICGALVEAIAGMPFADYMHTKLFAPLGMVDTGFWVPPEKRHRFADVYAESPRKPIGEALLNVSTSDGQLDYIGEAPPVFSSGGGGLVATMHDYARFCQCIANGGELGGYRLLGVKTVEWMATNHLPDGQTMAEMPAPTMGYSEVAAPGTGFGLGFSVVQNHTVSRNRGLAHLSSIRTYLRGLAFCVLQVL